MRYRSPLFDPKLLEKFAAPQCLRFRIFGPTYCLARRLQRRNPIAYVYVSSVLSPPCLPPNTTSTGRHPNNFANSAGDADPVRRRQLGQLARAKGPVERRLMKMRQSRRGLFDGGVGRGGETKGDDGNSAAFEEGDESLALIQW